MSCGFNPACYVWMAIEPFWIWIQVGFWIVVALAALWALAKLKEIGGWPAVVGAIGAAAYAIGWSRGRKGKRLVPDNLTELDDGPDTDPPKPRVVTKRHGRRWNPTTGNFEDY